MDLAQGGLEGGGVFYPAIQDWGAPDHMGIIIRQGDRRPALPRLVQAEGRRPSRGEGHLELPRHDLQVNLPG